MLPRLPWKIFFSYQDVIVPEQPPSPESNDDSISKQAPEKQTLSILNRTNDSGCVIQDSTSFDGSFYDAADCIFFSKNEKVTRPPGTFIYFHLFVQFFIYLYNTVQNNFFTEHFWKTPSNCK